jgi:hypothetical protein
MSVYVLRFFFDPGSGICLWAANDAARDKWDYPIEAQLLPIQEGTWRFADQLCSWYDTSVNWAYPPDPSPWSASEWAAFNTAAQGFLESLRNELGPDFEVIDESRTAIAA